jgi:hypothetical protein
MTAAAAEARAASSEPASSAKSNDPDVAEATLATPAMSGSLPVSRTSAFKACARSDNFIEIRVPRERNRGQQAFRRYRSASRFAIIAGSLCVNPGLAREAREMSSLSITGAAQEQFVEEGRTKVRQPLSFWKMALAVFVGNLLTALLGGFVYSLHLGW